jgi:hypothetical protein
MLWSARPSQNKDGKGMSKREKSGIYTGAFCSFAIFYLSLKFLL